MRRAKCIAVGGIGLRVAYNPYALDPEGEALRMPAHEKPDRHKQDVSVPVFIVCSRVARRRCAPG
jgi:hypothetical protein